MTRLLVDLSPCEPAFGLALEEALLDSARGLGTSALRWWVNDRSLIVGRSQSVRNEVDVAQARALRIPILRRISGGGTVLHHPGNLNLSLILSDSGPLGDVEESFARVGRALVAGLARLGIPARMDGNAILVGEKKVSGAAQARRGRAVLYHATLLVSPDRDRLRELLLAHRKGYRGGEVASCPREMTSLAEALGHRVAAKSVVEALVGGLDALLGEGATRARPTDVELDRARDLARMKYGSDEWNLSR